MSETDHPRTDTGAQETRSGFAALLGAPNAGKSTLLNQLVGSKLAIVTPKAQTTRTRLIGIFLEGDSQVALVDTPGIFAPTRRLDRAMVSAAWQGAVDADVIAVIVDAARKKLGGDTERIVEDLKRAERGAVLVLNKIDLMRRDRLLGLADRLFQSGVFSEVFMLSAMTGDGVDALRAHLAKAMPAGPWLFPEDQLTDLPMRLLAAETVRERLMLALHDELPYELTVEPEEWQNFDDGSVRISLTVFVRRDSQKAIVLGQGGRRIKQIGSEAREILAEQLGQKVHLFLFVKVRDSWLDDPERYRALGLDFNS